MISNAFQPTLIDKGLYFLLGLRHRCGNHSISTKARKYESEMDITFKIQISPGETHKLYGYLLRNAKIQESDRYKITKLNSSLRGGTMAVSLKNLEASLN